MYRILTLLTVILLLSISYIQAQTFPRTAEIRDPADLERGFGAVVAGVDFDADGLVWTIMITSPLSTADADKAHFEHVLETFEILE